MANSPELKTLNEIKEVLTKQNASQKELTDAYDKSQKAFPAESFKTLTKSTGDEIKKQRRAIQNMMDKGPDNTAAGLSKFLGVDFKSEFFDRLKSISTGFGDIKKGFKDLGKALGLNKVAKAAGGFWDFLKKILAVGLATVGFIKFLEGWNKADEIFGKSATFGERLSAGLATVIGSFMGLTDGEINKLALDINDTVSGIIKFLSTEFSNLATALKNAWPNIKLTFGGFIKILEGDFLGGISDMSGGILGAAGALLESESMLAKAVVALAAIKLAGAVTSFAGAIGPIFTAISTITSGLGTVFAAVGGKAALTTMLATLAPTLSAVLVPLGIALAAIVALKSIFDGFSAGVDEFEKSGDISQALSAGLGGFVKSLLNMLTLGLLSDETLDSVEKSVKKFLDPIFESIGDIFKSIWNWVKSSWDDAVFNIKDALGMELSADERFKKAEKDINEARANVIRKEEAVANSKSDYTRNKNQRYLNKAQKDLAEMEAGLSSQLNAKKIDNEILSNASSYEGYLKAVDNNTQLTDEQKKQERNEMINARATGESFTNFQNNQQTTNNMILNKLKPQAERVLSFSSAPTS